MDDEGASTALWWPGVVTPTDLDAPTVGKDSQIWILSLWAVLFVHFVC